MSLSLELLAVFVSAGVGIIQTGVLVEIARRQGKATGERESHGDRLDRHGHRLDSHGDRLDDHAQRLAGDST